MSGHSQTSKNISGKNYTFEIIFALIVLTDLLSIVYKPGLRLIVKPLIIASLLIYYVNMVQEKQKTIILVALLFALIGDILLLFDFPLFFMAGIATFLIMQLCYASYFKRFYQRHKTYQWLSYGFAFIGLLFNIVYWNKFGDLKIPVALYTLAICYMIFYGVNQKIGNALTAGVILFGISDLTIAFNKFVFSHIGFSLLVMVTYALAQYLIVKELILFTSVPVKKQ